MIAVHHMSRDGILGTFHNVFVKDAQVSAFQDYADITSFYDIGKSYAHVGSEYETAFTLIGETPALDAAFNIFDWLRERIGSNVGHRALGLGAVCDYCGTVWLPGTLRCQSCGALTTHRHNVMERTHEGIVTNWSALSRGTEYVEAYVSIHYTAVPKGTMRELVQRSIFGEPGDWLCPWCGFYAKNTISLCPGCGGNRLTISQLSDLKRTCIYCGRQVIGGYACPHCNTRLTNPKGVCF